MDGKMRKLQGGSRAMAVIFRILGAGALLLAAGVWGAVTLYAKTGFDPAQIASLGTLGALCFSNYGGRAAVAGALLQSGLVLILAGLSFLSAGAACAASRRTSFHEKSPGLLRRAGRLLLAARVGISNVNLSNIKTGKVSAIRFSTRDGICRALGCQPGDILEYHETGEEFSRAVVLGGAGGAESGEKLAR